MGSRSLRSFHLHRGGVGKSLASIFKTFACNNIDRGAGDGITGQRHTKAKLGKTPAGRTHNCGRRSRGTKTLGTPGSRAREIFHVRSLRGRVFSLFRSGILSDASCDFGSCSYRRHSIRYRGGNRQIGSRRSFRYGHTLVRRADPDADNCALLPGIEDTRNHLRIETSALSEEFVISGCQAPPHMRYVRGRISISNSPSPSPLPPGERDLDPTPWTTQYLSLRAERSNLYSTQTVPNPRLPRHFVPRNDTLGPS